MPTLAPSSDNVLLGKGKLLFDRFASGARTGFFHLGNCESFEITSEDDVIENQNFMIAAGGVYKSVTRARTVTANITGFEFATESLALAIMGEQTTVTQTTGTVTATLTTNATKGRFYRTADRSITVTQITQVSGTSTTTLTATTDYSVFDSNAGVIRTTAAGAVVNGSTLIVVYTKATITSLDAISGAKSSLVEGQLLFIPDPATGPKWEITAWRVSFTPDGAVGFIADDFGTWSIAGKVLDDSDGTYGGSASFPYYKAVQVA